MADTDWREAVLAAAKLPSDCGALALRYVGLFRPSRRALSPDRAARLIREVCAMITDGTEYRGAELKAPSHIWRSAFIEMLDRADLKLPLKNHRYLQAVVASKLAERVDAAQTERHQARRSEARVVTGPRRLGESLPGADKPDLLADLSPDERKRWMRAAHDRLIEEGFDKRWIVNPLIEAKAAEMLAEERRRKGGEQ